MALDPKYLKYRKRMVSRGKPFMSYKEWQESRGEASTKPAKKKRSKGTTGPCYVGTVKGT